MIASAPAAASPTANPPQGDHRGIRVLLAAHQSLPLGGIGTVAAGLATHLPDAIEPYGSLTVALPEGRLSTQLQGLGGRAAAARFVYEQGSLAWAARKFDLVHLCDSRPILLSRTPFVITVHDVNYLDRPEWTPLAARTYKARMLGAALRKRPAAIICHSEYASRRLIHHFPMIDRGDVHVIQPGVDRPAQEWTGAGDPPFFLTVSTIIPRKNHLGLLRAFRLARRAGLRLRWIVAGPRGPGSRGIVDALEREPGVSLVGEVHGRELERLYREAMFVATPSAIEGFGYPPLEAMARGTPTLTSSAASLPEVVGDAGPLLAPADTESWARALQWLAEDGEARSELSEKGLHRAGEFSWRRTAAATVNMYLDALG